ncbi:MAG: DUF389 domain-containing protein [Bacteroidota bacterium]
MFREVKEILLKIIHLRDTTDVRGTIESIRNSIEIRGYNVWILACGAMLASIGLDTNSVAVIIGAMLISPLMSPILGIGLSIGINDREHLVLALKNFGIAVGASLGVSTFYFLITPFGDQTPEILSRTYPTALDVFIAMFGGIAGIVAGSRKEKTNAIPGVAIATALMPPLCVAGYGIAKWQWDIFLGAAYLFFINSVFIALSTYLIVRFLRFPYVDYINESSRRSAARWIAIFAFLVILPSAYSLYNLIRQARLNNKCVEFIDNEVNNSNHQAIQHRTPAIKDSIHILKLVMAGPPISEDSMAYLETQLPKYGLKDVRLNIVQSQAPLKEEEILQHSTIEALEAIQPSLNKLQARMDSLDQEIVLLSQDTSDFTSLKTEINILFPDLQTFIFAEEGIQSDLKTGQDTLPLILTKWNRKVPMRTRARHQKKLGTWLQEKMNLDTIKVVPF